MEESNLEQNPNVQPQINIPQVQQPTQPVVNQNQVSKPAGKNKLPMMLIVIFILLIILGSGAYYLLNQSKNTNQQKQVSVAPTIAQNSPTPTIDETVNWKTYVNNDYGFSLKYPGQFTVKIDSYLSNKAQPFTLYNLWFYINENGVQKYSGISVKIHTSQAKTISQEYSDIWVKLNVSATPLNDTHGADEAVQIPARDLQIYYFRIKDKFFEVSFIIQDSTSTDKIWDYPIMDTFKFIGKTQTTDTSNWKTYTNTRQQFSLKYPVVWVIEDSGTIIYIQSPESITQFPNHPTQGGNVTVEVQERSSQENQNEFIARRQSTDIAIAERSNHQKTKFLNYPAVTYDQFNPFLEIKIKATAILTPWATYEIFLFNYASEKSTQQALDQILSTFQFLDQNQITANWKTYVNEKYKFEFKHPSDHTAFSDIDQTKPVLIPASAISSRVSIADSEEMLFCCEPVTLSFKVEKTDKGPYEWADEYLKSIGEWKSEISEIKNTIFQGKSAVESNGSGGYGPPYKLIVISIDNNQLLVINQNMKNAFLRQILSTFRFAN